MTAVKRTQQTLMLLFSTLIPGLFFQFTGSCKKHFVMVLKEKSMQLQTLQKEQKTQQQFL